jgi:hypothetical protein
VTEKNTLFIHLPAEGLAWPRDQIQGVIMTTIAPVAASPAAAAVPVADVAPVIVALDEAGRVLGLGDSVSLWDRVEEGYRVRVITDILLVNGDTVVLVLGLGGSFPYRQIPEEVNLVARASSRPVK